MRKYYQAALAVTAVVSLISLLLYRHEYNKLRYVLEVFNYFGKPGQKHLETNCTNNFPLSARFNMKFDEPVSSWQKLEDDLYVYSAYSIHDGEVHAISFGRTSSITSIQCIIFFRNEIKPFLAGFKYTMLNGTADDKEKPVYSGYKFICTHEKGKIPVGVAFLTKSNSHLTEAPILPVKVQPQTLNYGDIAVCVVQPLIKPMHEQDMISFVSFHDLVSMNNFIIYDYGIPNGFNSHLKEMAGSQNPYWKFTYTVLPWNFPFTGIPQDVIWSIINADCLYRTYNKVMYAITLSWEEYVVLKYHHSTIDLMGDFSRSKLVADRYKLQTSIFCTQQSDDKHFRNSSLMIHKKTRTDPSVTEARSVYVSKPYEILTKSNIYTREISKDLVVLNRYKYCDAMDPETSIRDLSIMRFNTDMQSSPIYKEYLAGNVFSLENR